MDVLESARYQHHHDLALDGLEKPKAIKNHVKSDKMGLSTLRSGGGGPHKAARTTAAILAALYAW